MGPFAMKEFLLSQMDFVFFIYGLAFILLFTFSAALYKNQRAGIPWHWLAFFGLTHGLNEWADLLALSFKDNTVLAWVRLGLMTVSFVCLLEFGRASCQRLKCCVVGRWIHIPLLAAAALAGLSGMSGFNAGARYTFGFCGAIAAACALYRLSGQHTHGKRSLKLAATGFGLYAVAAGLVVPGATFFPASFLNHGSFLNATGFPVQILRAVLATVIAFAIGAYGQTGRLPESDQLKVRRKGKFVAAASVALLFFLVAGWFLVNWAGEQAAVQKRKGLVHLSEQIALAVDYRQIQTLKASPQDADSLVYQYLKDQLQSLRRNVASIRFVYLMRKVEGKAVFLVDSEIPGSKDESPPGQVLAEAPPELMAAFSFDKTVIDGPSADRWGDWLSAYTPLNDKRTGEAIAILGVDQDARNYNRDIAAERFGAMLILGLLCLVASLALVYSRRFMDALEQADARDPFLQWGTLGIVLFSGLVLTGYVVIREFDRAQETFQTIFLQRASIRAQVVSQALALEAEKLEGVRRFFENSPALQRDEFMQYARPAMEESFLRSMGWAPRVRGVERADYQDRARKDGLAGFEIREVTADGKMISARERDEYFPVYFAEPLKGNEMVLGFDLFSDALRKATMQKSCDGGRAVLTPALRLLQDQGDRSGLLAFLPVYAKGSGPRTVEERRRDLRGFVLGVYNGPEFLKSIFSMMPAEGLSCLIEDPQAPPGSRVLYRHRVRLGAIDWDRVRTKYEVPLLVGTREWRMTIAPGSAFVDANMPLGYRWVLPTGIVLTGLAALLLNVLMTARYRMERLVRSRTRELLREKDSLSRSEERFRQIADVAGEFIWEVDRDCVYTYASPVVEKMYGYSPGEMVGKKHFYDFFLPRDKDKLMTELFTAVEKKQPLVDFFSPIIHRDGREVLLLTNAIPILDENGGLVGYRGVDRDITVARTTEELLREAEALRIEKEKYAGLVNNLHIGVYRNTPGTQGLFLEVNPAVVSMLEADSKEELLRHNVSDFYLAPLTRKNFSEKILTFGVVRDEEIWLKTLKGRLFLASVSAIRKQDEHGQIFFDGTIEDITERKRVEEELQRLNRQNRLILDSSADGILGLDDQGRHTFVNPAAARMLGYEVEELLGRPSHAIWHHTRVDGSPYPKEACQIYAAYRDGVVHRVVTEVFWRKDGTSFPVEYSSTPIRAQDRLVGAVVIFTDISERKKVQERLEQAASEWRRTFDSITDFVFLMDMDSRIVRLNRALSDAFGVRPQEMLGKKCYEVMHKFDTHATGCPFQELCKDGKAHTSEVTGQDNIPFLMTVSPVHDDSGKLIGAVHIAKDISEIKRTAKERDKAYAQLVATQAQLLQSEKMASIGQLAAGVAHEINNPANFVGTNLEVLETYIAGYLRMFALTNELTGVLKTGTREEADAVMEKMKEFEASANFKYIIDDSGKLLAQSRQGVDRIVKIVSDLNIFAHEETQWLDELVKVEDILEMALNFARSEIKYRIDLRKEYGDTPLVKCNAQKIGQVFLNLIMNAAQSIPDKGTIGIRTYVTDGRVGVDISDTGCGIPPENIARIFDPFYTTKPAGKGTGLGLSISYEIVKRQGGEIRVHSVPGQGTTFTVVLSSGPQSAEKDAPA